ncbi:MAG: Mut7-C ubiquitin/RNAse domain-containing protein [Leptospiraceae bacterium]|nr:Mut7-C ubiquitin/RNAse domain-containing protein [Leptospiraceae bacterium]MDW7976883.1 Mut7-C RNAse domain-containing protein [Leptospiraceae bacterium]
MKVVELRFYGKLVFLSKVSSMRVAFYGRRTIKDVVESLGVPHTEIFLVLRNQTITYLNQIIEHNDRISLYPMFFQMDREILREILTSTKLTCEEKKEYVKKYKIKFKQKFIADVHLGKLTRYLRLLGIDVLFNPKWNDFELIQISNQEKRVLLTQDKGILKQKRLEYGYYLISRTPSEQLQEILSHFHLKIKPFQRCSICNSILKYVDSSEILELQPIPVWLMETYEGFYVCEKCKKVYWEGSHYKKMVEFFYKYKLDFEK